MKHKMFVQDQSWRPLEVREMQKTEERRLLGAAKLGDRAAAATLVQSHSWLVCLLLRRSGLLVRDRITLDDLLSLGNLALLEAIRDFDLSGGRGDCLFATFAAWHLVGAFSHELRRRRRDARMRPLDDGLTAQLATPSERQTPDLPHGWRRLPKAWRKLLAMRFGLEGERARSAVEIAKEQRVTRGAVMGRLNRALQFLRERAEPAAA